MSPIREKNLTAAQWTAHGSEMERGDLTKDENFGFGSRVFSVATQRERLSEDVFDRLQATLARGEALDVELADAVADAMMGWALEHGATHYTHVFQPLTGLTAEKHDSFFNPTSEGGAIARFKGSELIQGEPDASSFPTGGIRATFEARGYTAWDPTSPAFLLENPNGTLLCIPTAFASWTGEALDGKIPLLRSMDALSREAVRAMKALGDEEVTRVLATTGAEQEYFLIEEQYYFARPDLILAGRTLFGTKPPKGHELDDHYFGSIPERVLACMMETERELAELGVPIKTRHNEVAPAQYEIAPMFENSNVSSDHQQLLMQVLMKVARKYGLVALLHEKPFDGVNGSGKHNNWSMGADTGENLLDPGDTPSENLNFLFFTAAVIQAVNRHQGLLRATAANIGQDHRLGAAEAPPAIMSIFLGEELIEVFEKIAAGEESQAAREAILDLGAVVLPPLPRHGGDRNRTSPFAFTGNKFEFRAPGSSQSIAFVNTVLNTIMAEALSDLMEKLDATEGQGDLVERVLRVVSESWNENRRIVFEGDGYSTEWEEEATRRGLKNLRTTPDALPEVIAAETIEAFERFDVLSQRELEARFEVWTEQYAMKANIEADTATTIARTMIIPAVAKHVKMLHESGADRLEEHARELLDRLIETTETLNNANQEFRDLDLSAMDLALYARDRQLAAMNEVRDVVDHLERIVADDIWPLPRYSEMMFIK
ncbi:MAG: glutamine synthetase III [Solirubrobacterales bacterium]|nr:glutamine synthetase III [Solirubrobacterales bacterium]